MPVLQLDDQQFPLKAGATRIGAGADADVIVPGYSAIGIEAIIDGGATPTIRRADEEAHVRVNGVLLGAEPTPLMHGDKVEIAGLELRFSDDAKGGATQFVNASDIASLKGAKRAGSARATAASGGRLVSLVDGKEYAVPDMGIVFGRDAACDVVVAQNEVSRRHAEIVPDEHGYLVRDTSANGLYVNGERVQGSHRLARSDVLRIGTEEFRFYADVVAVPKTLTPAKSVAAVPVEPIAPPPPTPAPAAPVAAEQSSFPDLELLPEPAKPAAPAPVPAAPPPVAAPVEAAKPLEAPKAAEPPKAAPVPPKPPAAAPPKPTPVATPVTPVSSPLTKDPRPVMAILESMNEGPGKGTKYELHTPLGHVGRGAHNDVRLSDESVSETHAKLQRREDGWYVVDMDSTNGTYVGGTRVMGERRIEGSPDVRFGGMKFRFTAVGAGAVDVEGKGTRAIATMGRASALAAKHATPPSSIPAQSAQPAPQAPVAEPVTPAASGGIPAWVWIVAVLVIAGVAFFLLKGRA
jgi:pSer/pThr/pTyr-binding forkhead associated (FHA) protein